jgi:hypothetical protein
MVQLPPPGWKDPVTLQEQMGFMTPAEYIGMGYTFPGPPAEHPPAAWMPEGDAMGRDIDHIDLPGWKYFGDASNKDTLRPVPLQPQHKAWTAVSGAQQWTSSLRNCVGAGLAIPLGFSSLEAAAFIPTVADSGSK